MKEFSLVVDIAAPREKVWEALADFDKYSLWNPVVPQISGRFEVGQCLQHRLIKIDGSEVEYTPTVLAVEAPRHSVLAKALIHKKLIYLVHTFSLGEPLDGVTKFTQTWQCTGLLVPLLWRELVGRFKNFEKSNNSLKNYLENKA